MSATAARTSKTAPRERRAAPRERRAAPRRPLCLEAQAELAPGSSTPVVIHNLSKTGFVMEAAGAPAIGAGIVLELLGEPVPAQLIWNCGSHFGCEFERPLSGAMVSAAVLQSRPATAAEALPRRLQVQPPAVSATEAQEAPRTGPVLALVLSTLVWAIGAALIL